MGRCCRYFSCRNRKQHKKADYLGKQTKDTIVDYSSGESDSEYVQMFTYLPTDEKFRRIMHFWKRCDVKLRGAVALADKLRDLRIKVLVHGKHNAVKHQK